MVLVALALNLGIISYLLYVRLSAGGAPQRDIGWLLGELWLTFAAAVGMLTGISRLLGPSAGYGTVGEAADIGRRFSLLAPGEKVLAAAGLVLTMGLVVHVMRRLNRMMDAYPPRLPSE